MFGLFALLLVSGPLAAQDIPQTGLAHSASKAAYSAAAYVVLREGAGLGRAPAAVLSTVGVFVAAKAVVYVQHPDWLGPWSPGDWTQDLLWHSLIVVPLAFGPRDHPWRVIGSLGTLGGGIMLSRGWALPRW